MTTQEPSPNSNSGANAATASSQAALFHAAALILQGEVVAFPTETVYGLGADAFNPAAVQKIYALKGRPSSNPLIVHIAHLEQLASLAEPLTDVEQKLITAFWPGPLTLILKKKSTVPESTTAGLDTVAVRMPQHPLALALIEASQTPIAAPSANPSGKPSATHHAHIQNYFGARVFCLEGGASTHGLESTVVHHKNGRLHVYRLGSILPEDLEAVLQEPVILETHSVHSPGTRFRHYAPQARVEIVEKKDGPSRLLKAQQNQENVALILPTEWLEAWGEAALNHPHFDLGSEAYLPEIGSHLYAALIAMDTPAVSTLLLPAFPPEGLGKTLMDRLTRAAEKIDVEEPPRAYLKP